MPEALLQPDEATFNAAMRSCEDWVQALGLLREMSCRGLEPNTASYKGAMSACSESGSWEPALVLLWEMPTM